eukprot:Opistho-1_new@87088
MTSGVYLPPLPTHNRRDSYVEMTIQRRSITAGGRPPVADHDHTDYVSTANNYVSTQLRRSLIDTAPRMADELQKKVQKAAADAAAAMSKHDARSREFIQRLARLESLHAEPPVIPSQQLSTSTLELNDPSPANNDRSPPTPGRLTAGRPAPRIYRRNRSLGHIPQNVLPPTARTGDSIAPANARPAVAPSTATLPAKPAAEEKGNEAGAPSQQSEATTEPFHSYLNWSKRRIRSFNDALALKDGATRRVVGKISPTFKVEADGHSRR